MILEIIQTIAIIAILIVVLQKNKPLEKMKSKGKKESVALLDSCALIDGRIIELAKAGFITPKLEVPEFILAELQLLADGNDSQKRERARFGLEVVRLLQAEPSVEIEVNYTKIDATTTDDKLVKLAQKTGADLFTTDFNLNQVASIEGVRVLNVNELAHSLRQVALPGEDITMRVIQTGSNRDQGVGYLEDGTMVVIDNARQDIGKEIQVKITRTHQTVAGKMLFAKKVGDAQEAKKIPTTRPKVPIKKIQPTNRQYKTPKPASKRYQPIRDQQMTKQEASLFDAIDNAPQK